MYIFNFRNVFSIKLGKITGFLEWYTFCLCGASWYNLLIVMYICFCICYLGLSMFYALAGCDSVFIRLGHANILSSLGDLSTLRGLKVPMSMIRYAISVLFLLYSSWSFKFTLRELLKKFVKRSKVMRNGKQISVCSHTSLVMRFHSSAWLLLRVWMRMFDWFLFF